MTIKRKESVQQYTEAAIEIQAALRNLLEWAETLPCPEDDGELYGVDYSDLSQVLYVRQNLGYITRIVDQMTGIRP